MKKAHPAMAVVRFFCLNPGRNYAAGFSFW